MHACAFEYTADTHTHTVIEQCERIKNVTNSILTHRFLLVICHKLAYLIIGLDTIEGRYKAKSGLLPLLPVKSNLDVPA